MRLVVAGGGTGGHVLPGVAVARAFLKISAQNEVLYIGAAGGMEERLVPKYGLELRLLSVGGIKGKGIFTKLRNIIRLLPAIKNALGTLRKFKPAVVLGVGGYASYPAMFAARLLGIKSAVQEQNTVPGLANRVLGLLADRVYVAFKQAERYFPSKKVLFTGNPIREEIIETLKSPKTGSGRFNVLVLGGSQGAVNLNSRMLDALDELSEFKEKIRFVHQTGEKEIERVRSGYGGKGFSAEVFSFRENIAEALREADIVVSRAGSGICEFMAAGKPSILVPYPHSAYGHQEINARWLADEGAAIAINDGELSGADLAVRIKKFMSDRRILENMAQNALRLAKPRAAGEVAKDLFLLGGGTINA